MSSDFRNDPPRLQLRTKDNLEGKNPVVARSGMRTGVGTSSFNDTSTIIFSAITQGTFPQILPVNSQYISTSYITGSLTVRKSVSDGLINFYNATPGFGPFIEKSHFEQSQDPFFLTSSDDRFDEKLRDKVAIRIDISTGEDALFTRASNKRLSSLGLGGSLSGSNVSGFSYFNFINKKWEMIGLTDPETGAAMHFDNTVDSSSSIVVSGTNNYLSQFVSYDGSWVTSSISTLLAESASVLNARKLIGTPTVTNFAPFANWYHATASQTLKLSNYIKQPFLLEKVTVQLPIKAERKSNDTALSASINFSVPQNDFVFFMYRQEQNYFVTNSLNTTNDYTLYGIVRSPNRSKVWATGSMRYLICSGVMTFYNSTASVAYPLTASTPDSYPPVVWYPLNTPAFQYNWGKTSSDNLIAANAANYTGSVTLNIPVAVASPMMINESRFFSSFATSSAVAKLTHYWPGGTSCLPFGKNNLSGKQVSVHPQSQYENSGYSQVWGSQFKAQGASINDPAFGLGTYEWYVNSSNSPDFNSAKKKAKIEKFDERVSKKLGNSKYVTTVSGVMSYIQSEVCSYLLLPGDELIFGMDAALGRPPLRYTTADLVTSEITSIQHITGTSLTITTGDATVVLYGSYIKDGKATPASHSQFLTSENISEVIAEDICDQYDLVSREHQVGTTNDLIIVGDINSYAIGNFYSAKYRHVYGSDATLTKQGQSYYIMNNAYEGGSSAFSLANASVIYERRKGRKMSLISFNEVIYDSLVPDPGDYITSMGGIVTGSYLFNTTHVHVTDLPKFGKMYKFPGALSTTYGLLEPILESNSVIKPYPFISNPGRAYKPENAYLILTASNAPFGGPEFIISNQDTLKIMLFTRGWSSNIFKIQENQTLEITGEATYKNNLTGSSQLKYGLYSCLPVQTKQIYRCDKFGQFRDLLEGRKFMTSYDPIGLANDGSYNNHPGKKDGPVEIKFWNRTENNFSSSPSDSYLSGSSNRSAYATSSMPYIDGVYYNWGTVL